jgi:hypothetical protein
MEKQWCQLHEFLVDSTAGKMGLVGDQNVVNHMGVRINPTA